MLSEPNRIFTIGHSNHPLEKFVRLLQANAIQVLVDVRSAPYSKHNPQFNLNEISTQIPKVEIRYVYAGKELGGRPTDPDCYKNDLGSEPDHDYLHEVNYPEVMKRDWFQQGIQRLLELAKSARLCIMCSEEDPAQCHRHHLIAKFLMDTQPELEIIHIRGDGNLVKASQIRRTVDDPPSEQLSLF